MRTFFGLILFAPLAVIVGVFVVENRSSVSLQMWPLSESLRLWASLWVLIPLAAGILFGMAVGWLSGTGWRRRARRAERRIAALERQLDAAEEAPPHAPPVNDALPPPASAGRRTQIGG